MNVLSAYHFITVVLLGKDPHGWLNDTTSEPQHKMKGRLCVCMVHRVCVWVGGCAGGGKGSSYKIPIEYTTDRA